MQQVQSSRYRHIRGGLDLAAKQAEERCLDDMMIVDGDCHYMPFLGEVAKYMSKDWHTKFSFPVDDQASPV